MIYRSVQVLTKLKLVHDKVGRFTDCQIVYNHNPIECNVLIHLSSAFNQATLQSAKIIDLHCRSSHRLLEKNGSASYRLMEKNMILQASLLIVN